MTMSIADTPHHIVCGQKSAVSREMIDHINITTPNMDGICSTFYIFDIFDMILAAGNCQESH